MSASRGILFLGNDARRVFFVFLESLVVGSAIVVIWAATGQKEISRTLSLIVCLGNIVAPLPLIGISISFFRTSRHLFWIGILTVVCLIVVMALPIVPAHFL